MFSTWKQEKATAALVDAAQDLADRLETARPHIRDSQAAAARFWAAFFLAEGKCLHEMTDWTPAALTRFISAAQTRIAALRKAREYDSSDGLAIWLHTARAVVEPRIAPPVRDIWQHLSNAGQNAETMAQDLLRDAGMAPDGPGRTPKGFAPCPD